MPVDPRFELPPEGRRGAAVDEVGTDGPHREPGNDDEVDAAGGGEHARGDLLGRAPRAASTTRHSTTRQTA